MKTFNRVLTASALLLSLGSAAYAQSYDAHPNQFDTFHSLNGAEAASGLQLYTGRSVFSGAQATPEALVVDPDTSVDYRR